ncbi:uncharacterized protein LOC115691234 [Syzygium oleosum]|uniref:uncharacterized protein LOC115691234 n=1 Tax=Syzygium oleosum TaxID=219896 RepID=UPI0024B87C38|nr:uncharacterized protein LOC115691234 [Syzygium oleosum]XP_056162205.1 uncharacterized protein LOC115691234 [Syzygium oleosum]XP_056162206.1 uncharacterized protein LOC115691234 [Syzygium oleosum]XP_056162207.1 uncharacterized protein LOC115691234 [Syzygium oleosum]
MATVLSGTQLLTVRMKHNIWPKPSPLPWQPASLFFLKPPLCTPVQHIQQEADAGIICEPCNGKGWLVCDFCKGQKTNVKAENRRIYRRCPSCRAIGFVLCSKCKVYKCVTFPDSDDGEESSL